MGTFDSIMADSVVPQNVELHGEPATFKPSTGSPVDVDVILERGQLEPEAAMGGTAIRGFAAGYEIKACIPMAAVPTINFGGDKLAIKKRKGDAATTDMVISSLINQDGGFWRVRLQD